MHGVLSVVSISVLATNLGMVYGWVPFFIGMTMVFIAYADGFLTGRNL